MNLTLGAVQSPPDRRDYPVAITLEKEPVGLPTANRLTEIVSMPPVYDQGSLPSCVATSISAMAEWHERAELGTSVRLDDAKFYYRCKEMDGYPGDGTFPRVAYDLWKNEGIYADNGRGPAHFRIKNYFAVPLTDVDIAQVLYQKKQPVSLVLNWPTSWFGIGSTGIPPILPVGFTSAGLHQVWVWGFDFARSDHGLLIRNSWSKEWGLNGSFWLGKQGTTRNLMTESWYGESQP
jgi:hypothetical protein